MNSMGGGGGMPNIMSMMSDMMNGGPPRPPNNDYGEGLGPNGGLGGGPGKGENAIDCILHDPITGSGIQLSELWVQSNGYLCISFGSCSCNMFRGAHMDLRNWRKSTQIAVGVAAAAVSTWSFYQFIYLKHIQKMVGLLVKKMADGILIKQRH